MIKKLQGALVADTCIEKLANQLYSFQDILPS